MFYDNKEADVYYFNKCFIDYVKRFAADAHMIIQLKREEFSLKRYVDLIKNQKYPIFGLNYLLGWI